jgi:hypothetical protein
MLQAPIITGVYSGCYSWASIPAESFQKPVCSVKTVGIWRISVYSQLHFLRVVLPLRSIVVFVGLAERTLCIMWWVSPCIVMLLHHCCCNEPSALCFRAWLFFKQRFTHLLQQQGKESRRITTLSFGRVEQDCCHVCSWVEQDLLPCAQLMSQFDISWISSVSAWMLFSVGLGFKQSQSPPHVICSCPRAAVYPSTPEGILCSMTEWWGSNLQNCGGDPRMQHTIIPRDGGKFFIVV